MDCLTLVYIQVATDALVSMEKAMKRDMIETNDRQLACARINSKVTIYSIFQKLS